jgi:Glyoxalase-like domain
VVSAPHHAAIIAPATPGKNTVPQTAIAGSLVLDHVAHFVPDLGAAAAALETLGFVVTPYSAQATPEGPTGTANRCVMLDAGYIELLAPVADTPHAHRTREAMARYPGVHILALGTPDAAAEHARLARHGFAPLPAVDLARDVEMPDGAPRRARFGVVRVPPETMPEGRVQFVEQKTPECLWQPRWLAHGNGVEGLAAVFVVADDPPATAARYARFAGLAPRPTGAFVRLPTARGDLLVGRREDFVALLGSAPAAPALAGYALACRDPEELRGRCARAGAVAQPRGTLYSARMPPALGGAWLFGTAGALASYLRYSGT